MTAERSNETAVPRETQIHTGIPESGTLNQSLVSGRHGSRRRQPRLEMFTSQSRRESAGDVRRGEKAEESKRRSTYFNLYGMCVLKRKNIIKSDFNAQRCKFGEREDVLQGICKTSGCMHLCVCVWAWGGLIVHFKAENDGYTNASSSNTHSSC